MIKTEQKGKTIWAAGEMRPNCHVVFRKSFVLQDIPDRAKAHIAVDTRYWLFINGEPVVSEGGLLRESIPGAGYTDSVDIVPCLQPGPNLIAIHVWYFGNEGRNSTDSGNGGLLFQCPAINIMSDESFKCLVHPAYYDTAQPRPSGLYAGHNLAFDASKDLPGIYSTGFDDSGWAQAAVQDPGTLGPVCRRPVPLFRCGERREAPLKERDGRKFVMQLPLRDACVPVL